MNNRLAALYPQHLATLRERADRALALGGFDHLLIAAGTPLRKFLDDQDYPFIANPHFRHWLPLTAAVELVRPMFMDRWPAHALRHLLVLAVYAVGAFWAALALTRRRFAA